MYIIEACFLDHPDEFAIIGDVLEFPGNTGPNHCHNLGIRTNQLPGFFPGIIITDGTRTTNRNTTSASNAPIRNTAREIITVVQFYGLDRANPDTGITRLAFVVFDEH